jgi:hypothetical protein
MESIIGERPGRYRLSAGYGLGRDLRASKCAWSRVVGLSSADMCPEERVEWIENKVGTIESSLTEVRDAVQQITDASKKMMVMLEAVSKAK